MDEEPGGEQTRVSMGKEKVEWEKCSVWIWVEHGPKYKEKDWTNSDLRESRYMKRNGLEGWVETSESTG